MESLKTLIDSLNLIYYEYDGRSGRLVVDRRCGESDYSMELVSITHLLKRHRIPYRIDKEKNVRISLTPSGLPGRIKEAWHALLGKRRDKQSIYVLSDKRVRGTVNLPVFEIRPLPVSIDFSRYDAIIFTSKNGVSAIDATDRRWKSRPVYAIAPQTAKVVKRLGGQLRFVGKSRHGDSFAAELIAPLKGKRVLYLRASRVVSNLVQILNENGVICDEASVYETVCKSIDASLVPPKHATIIFSSPSTIECFLKQIPWDESYKAVAIGKTTAAYFPPHILPSVAETTSLASCVSKALEINGR